MIDVAIATDARYVPWAATAMLSVLDRSPRGSVRFHLLRDETLDTAEEHRLTEFVASNGGEIRVPSEALDLSTLPALDRFGRVVWLRFQLPDLLPDVDRVLYLDADTFVVDDLEPLWTADLQSNPIAAVANVVEPAMRPHVSNLGLKDWRRFFNSGVLLMDLERLRSEQLWAALTKLVDDRGEHLVWPDQDALNLLFADRWTPLHPRYNVMNSLWNWTDWANEVFGPDMVREATNRPAILHFEGPSLNKPWHYLSFHPWRDDYRRTLARTPWADTPIEGRTVSARLVSVLPKRWRHRAYFELGRVNRRLTSNG